jgi:hypothetical protein
MIPGPSTYQRRFLRAPLHQPLLFVDGPRVERAQALNVSEDGILLAELSGFPDGTDVPLMMAVPKLPPLKSLDASSLRTLSPEQLELNVFRAAGRMARRGDLVLGPDSGFRSNYGIQFTRLSELDRAVIAEYVQAFATNLVHLQALIDSYNADPEAREKVRPMARLLGYEDLERISQLRAQVLRDYRNLQWL